MQIERRKLMDLLKRVAPAVNSRSTLPILGCVKMDVEPGIVTLDATDLGMRAVAWDAVEGDEKWSAAIPAGFLTKLLGMIEDPKLTLEPKRTGKTDKTPVYELHLHYGAKGKCTLKVMDTETYPAMDYGEWCPISNVAGKWLKDLDAKIGFVSHDDPYGANRGLFERIHLGAEATWAMDKSRMVYDASMAVPGKGLHVLASLVHKAAQMMVGEEEIALEVAGSGERSYVRLLGANGYVVMDTEEVKLPDISKLVAKKEGGSSLLFERALLQRYLKIAGSRVSEKDNVVLCIDAAEADAASMLYLDNGEKSDFDPKFAGPSADVPFFAALPVLQVIDSVAAITDPFVLLRFFDKTQAVRICGSDNQDRFHLLAPFPTIQPRPSLVREALPVL